MPTYNTDDALGFVFEDLVTFDAGFAFGGPSAGNVITIPDNLADALHIIDDGAGDVFFKIITTTGSEEVIFNDGGDDVNFRVKAVGVVNAFYVDGAAGGITVGGPSMTVPTTWWVGLGGGAGRLTFTDAVVDTAIFSDCHVGLDVVPTQRLQVSGNAIFSGGLNVGDLINAPIGGGMRFARVGVSEPFLLFENAAGANALSQVRGINGGGIRLTDGTGATDWLRIISTGRASFGGVAAPLAQVHIDQSAAGGVIPVLLLDQADLSEEFIEFTTTVGAGNPIDTAALGAYYGKARVMVTGVGYKVLALYEES